MTEVTTPSTGEPGLIGRAIGVITSPGATFAHVVRDPRPAVILFALALVVAVAGTAPLISEQGRFAARDAMLEAAQQSGSGEITEQQVAVIDVMARWFPALAAVGPFIFMPLRALFFAVLLWGLFNALLGGTASFKQVLGIVTHSMVILAVATVAVAVLHMVRGSVSLQNPFALSGLVPMLDADGILARFLGTVSASTLWEVIVVAIGLGVLYRRKATGIAIGLLTVYGLVGVVRVAFSSFLGG